MTTSQRTTNLMQFIWNTTSANVNQVLQNIIVVSLINILKYKLFKDKKIQLSDGHTNIKKKVNNISTLKQLSSLEMILRPLWKFVREILF
jgi:hypothetical protein